MRELFANDVAEACEFLLKIKTQDDFYRVIHEAYDKYGCDIVNAARERIGCYNAAQYSAS